MAPLIMVWIVCGIAGYRMCESKGRDPWLGACLGFLIGIFGLLIVAILPSRKRPIAQTLAPPYAPAPPAYAGPAFPVQPVQPAPPKVPRVSQPYVAPSGQRYVAPIVTAYAAPQPPAQPAMPQQAMPQQAMQQPQQPQMPQPVQQYAPPAPLVGPQQS